MRKNILIIIILAAACMTGCSGPGYNPDKCDKLIVESNSARNLSDISSSTWQQIYDQYIAINIELNDKVDALLNTPWSKEKETEINNLFAGKLYKHWVVMGNLTQALLYDGFMPARYFDKSEIDRMVLMTNTTKTNILNLRAQADM